MLLRSRGRLVFQVLLDVTSLLPPLDARKMSLRGQGDGGRGIFPENAGLLHHVVSKEMKLPDIPDRVLQACRTGLQTNVSVIHLFTNHLS